MPPPRPVPVPLQPARLSPQRPAVPLTVKLETRKLSEARDEYESPVLLYGDELLVVPVSQE